MLEALGDDGYRSGFVVGDPQLIDALVKFRPSVGVATPTFVQAVATKAWGDDQHARAMADTYRRRRDLFLALFAKRSIDGGNATFYLWLRVPDGVRDAVPSPSFCSSSTSW
ncbi:MAG: aminotransferase class I/II-fold pyridoxal phosphate-dependent enzyme [Planctomycetota bacterium]